MTKRQKGLKGLCLALALLAVLAVLPVAPAHAAGQDKTGAITFESITFSLLRGGSRYPFATLTWDESAQDYTLDKNPNITISKGDEVALNVAWNVENASAIEDTDFFTLKFNTGGLFLFPGLPDTDLEGDICYGKWGIDSGTSTITVTFNSNVELPNQLVNGYINVHLGTVGTGDNVPIIINGEEEFKLTVKEPSQGGHGSVPGSGIGQLGKEANVDGGVEKIRWMITGYGDAIVKFYDSQYRGVGQPPQPLKNVVVEDTVTNGQVIITSSISIQLVLRAPFIETNGSYAGNLFSLSPAYISLASAYFTYVDGTNFTDPLVFKQAVMDSWPAYGVFDDHYLVVALGPLNDGSVPGALRPIDIINDVTSTSDYASYDGNGLTKLLNKYEKDISGQYNIVFSSLQRLMMADAYYSENNAVKGGMMDFRVVFDTDASNVPNHTTVPNTVRLSNEGVITGEASKDAAYSYTGAGVSGWYNGRLTLTKLDRSTGQPLEGVGFLLQKWDGSAWRYYTYSPTYTDAAGQLVFTQMVEGRYKIVEVLPLPGYSSDAVYSPGAEFTVAKGHPSTEHIYVTATNQRIVTETGGKPPAPQTGDGDNLPVWAMGGTVALLGLGLCAMGLHRRRRAR